MARWVMRCDPTRWRIYDLVSAGHPLTSWPLTGPDAAPHPGDDLALWVSGRPGGVIGLARAAGEAAPATDDDRYWTDPSDRPPLALPIRVTRLFLDDPVPRDVLAGLLGEPPAAHPLTDAEWRALQGHLAPSAGLLRGLVGADLTTVAGRRNRILAVRPPDVIVATGRAPDGQPIPIAAVDRALSELHETGRVELNARRPPFVGAVLRTLPGARVDDTAILLDPPPGAGTPADLRRRLFGARGEAMCALCGDVYPVALLAAAHIKKHAACTGAERRDLDNIAMPVCLVGCAALYEAGYLAVDPSGHIVTAAGPHPRAVAQRLERLARRRTNAHNVHTEPYFRWHRDNAFLGA